jgi:hypothetical protein
MGGDFINQGTELDWGAISQIYPRPASQREPWDAFDLARACVAKKVEDGKCLDAIISLRDELILLALRENRSVRMSGGEATRIINRALMGGLGHGHPKS